MGLYFVLLVVLYKEVVDDISPEEETPPTGDKVTWMLILKSRLSGRRHGRVKVRVQF